MAYITFEGFLPCMGMLMSSKVPLKSKSFMAHLTLKQFLPGFNLLVLMEERGSLVFISISTSLGEGVSDKSRNCRITSCWEKKFIINVTFGKFLIRLEYKRIIWNFTNLTIWYLLTLLNHMYKIYHKGDNIFCLK